MTNILVTNPIVCNATGLLLSGSGRIKSITFSVVTDSDSGIVLTDSTVASGTKQLVHLETTAEQHTVIYAPAEGIPFVNGLYCETIDAGEALIQI